MMAKRKREEDLIGNGTHRAAVDDASIVHLSKDAMGVGKKIKTALDPLNPRCTIQIVVGTYEKVLHGIIATVVKQGSKASAGHFDVEFADTFLLASHSSAIRCLAISPLSSDVPGSKKVILASGGSDQVINLYHMSTVAPAQPNGRSPSVPTLTGTKVVENPRNRELGFLEHHSGSISALCFPTRSKLLSAAEDSTIAVTRTRDWTVLSTIKAPIPKAHGRPSGDTAPSGGTPAGVNDFAIHPSLKLMVSVAKGERCMRLWNLITGKKAGVLNFEKVILQGVGEGRWASGEGRRIEWNSLGEEFVVGFERGCVVFGMDSKPRYRIMPSPTTKIHQMRYLSISDTGGQTKDVLAVSTEDGRILFYSTDSLTESGVVEPSAKLEIPLREAFGQLGGAAEGTSGRIKDFEILNMSDSRNFFIVTGSSDGAIRVWLLDEAELVIEQSVLDMSLQNEPPNRAKVVSNGISVANNDGTIHAANKRTSGVQPNAVTQIGTLLGSYETGNRITCLKAFTMSPPESLQEDLPAPDINGPIDENE